MFGRKKLKRIINNLQLSRDGWAETAVALSKEAKGLKTEIETLRKSRDELVKITNDRGEEIKTLKYKNIELNKMIDDNIATIQELRTDAENSRDRYKTDIANYISIVTDKGCEIKTLESEVQRLTRKRDANGRYVKMCREFKVGDKVRIKKGISSKTHGDAEQCFTGTMDRFIGAIQVIERIEGDDVNFKGDPLAYDFNIDWLEHVD